MVRFCETKVRLEGADYQRVEVPLQEGRYDWIADELFRRVNRRDGSLVTKST